MGRRLEWNLNIHYDARLARHAKSGDRVLDVGCGDGFLAARLADHGCVVVAIDADAPVLARARARWPSKPIEWIHGDVLTHPFAPASFDVVVSNATLHHLPDTALALARLAELTTAGGRLGIVGFARNGLADWPMSILSSLAIFVVVRVKRKWEHTAPVVWPPPLTYGQVKRVSGTVLPRRRFRRLWLGRYWLSWTRPA